MRWRSLLIRLLEAEGQGLILGEAGAQKMYLGLSAVSNRAALSIGTSEFKFD